MKFTNLFAGAVAAIGATLGLAAPASATTDLVTFDISGDLNGVGAYTGSVSLDVANGQATSGSGLVSGLGYTNVPMVLITTATPGNETAGGPSYPVGFRANDGTDLFGADTAFPLDSNGGLLFDVGTSTAAFGQFPLLNIYDGGSLFDGEVNGTEYYVEFGTLTVSDILSTAVPEPATWAIMLVGLGGLGAAMRRRRRLAA